MISKEEDEEFKALISQVDPTESVKKEVDEVSRTADIIMEEIAKLRVKVTETKNKLAPTEQLFKHWSDEEQKILDLLKKTRENKYKYEAEMRNAKSDIKSTDSEIQIKERELARLRLLEAEHKGFLDAAEQMLKDTAGRPWREWALDHQITGAQALAFAGRGFLGDKMGLGKTLTSIIWSDMVKAKRVLVFAPKEILSNFGREIQRWAPDRYIIDMVSISKINRDIYLTAIKNSGMPQFIILVNLEAWRKDPELIKSLIDIQADTVIIDEAHNIKNTKGNAFEGIENIIYAQNECIKCGGNSFSQRRIVKPDQNYPSRCWYCNSCEHVTWEEIDICSVKHVLPMTGTPILNRPQELWSSLYFVNKKMFPSESAFLYDYCESICSKKCEAYLKGLSCKCPKRWRFQTGGLESLSQKIGKQFIMRDRNSTGIIIPPQTIQVHDLEFDKVNYNEQWKAYTTLAKFAVIEMQGLAKDDKGELPIPAFITMLLRFRQMMEWPEGIEVRDPETKQVVYKCPVRQSLKLDYAEKLAKEIVASGERLIVFSHFKEPLREFHRRLNGHILPEDDKVIKSVVYDGDTPNHLREQIKTNFDRANPSSRNPMWDVCFANYRVGGTGLNLTAATSMIILGREWNPGKEDQALARIDRIGQTQETTVHRINTISEEMQQEGILLVDAFMDELMDQKKEVVSGFEGSTKNMTASFLEMLNKIKDK